MSVDNKEKDKYYGECQMKLVKEMNVFNGDPNAEIGDQETASTFSAMSKGSMRKSQRGTSPDKVSFVEGVDGV